MNQIYVWSNGGMIQTGENGSTRTKICSSATLHHTPHTDWLWIEPGSLWKKCNIFEAEFIEKIKVFDINTYFLRSLQKYSKIVALQAIKAFRVSRCIASFILNLDT